MALCTDEYIITLDSLHSKVWSVIQVYLYIAVYLLFQTVPLSTLLSLIELKDETLETPDNLFIKIVHLLRQSSYIRYA